MAGQTVIVSVLSDTAKFSKGMQDASSKAGATFATIGKVAAVGLLAAGAAVVGLTKNVVDAYAQYEQNIGGIETLFGKSAGAMEKYAASAYKTAGLSANEYMSQVTSFSSALIAGVGGDTDKAAKIANRAMTDMSDNANKFGTDISLVQNAYQGFAKQNYTMLDNLKLGYGGTQAEMARLINDSGVLGDGMKVTAETVKNVSYDKIIEAIGVVQDKMGVTGTTAREAASTISGSIGMLQGSWANLVTGMGDANADIGALVQNVGDSLKAVVTNITPVVQQVMNTLPQVLTMLIPLVLALIPDVLQAGVQMVMSLVTGVMSALPNLIAQVVPMLLMFVQSILGQLPMLLDAGYKTLIELVNGVIKAIPTLIPVAIDTVLKLVDTILDNLPMVIETGINLIVTLALALINALPKLAAKVPQIVIKIVTTLIDNIDKIIDAGVTLLLAIVENMPAILKGIVGAIPQIITAIVTALVKAAPKIADAGVHLVEGLWKGISDGYSWIVGKIRGWVNNVIDFIKGAFGIHSPSTVMASMGDYMVQGLAKGITDNVSDVTRAMGFLNDAVGGSFEGNLALDTVRAGGTVNQYFIDGVELDLTPEESRQFEQLFMKMNRQLKAGA